MENKRLEQVNKYWDNFNKGDYTRCNYIIMLHIDSSLITSEMFYKALEVKTFELCVKIIWGIDETLITPEMFSEALKHGEEAIRVCEAIISCKGKSLTNIDIFNKALEAKVFKFCVGTIDYTHKSLITTEMYDKALEAEAYYLCCRIIKYIDENLITVEMFNKALEHGEVANDLCQAIINRVGFGFLTKHFKLTKR